MCGFHLGCQGVGGGGNVVQAVLQGHLVVQGVVVGVVVVVVGVVAEKSRHE